VKKSCSMLGPITISGSKPTSKDMRLVCAVAFSMQISHACPVEIAIMFSVSKPSSIELSDKTDDKIDSPGLDLDDLTTDGHETMCSVQVVILLEIRDYHGSRNDLKSSLYELSWTSLKTLLKHLYNIQSLALTGSTDSESSLYTNNLFL